MSAPTPKVLSLGAGVQSTCLLLMAAEDHPPGLDVAIFADTGWEPSRTYESSLRINVHIVSWRRSDPSGACSSHESG